MKKIDYFKFNDRFINWHIKNFKNKISSNEHLLSDKIIRILKVLLSYDDLHLNFKNMILFLKNNKIFDSLDINEISENELLILYDILNDITLLLANFNHRRKMTLDEMEYFYSKLVESNFFSGEILELFKFYILVRKEKVDKLNLCNGDMKNLESLIIEMSVDDINKLKDLLGTRKKPVFLHLRDYSNFKKINEEYIFDLSDEEMQLDSLIDRCLEKIKRKLESKNGFSFSSKISDIFLEYSNYNKYLIEESEKRFEISRQNIFKKYTNSNYEEEMDDKKKNISCASKEDLENIRKNIDKISIAFDKFNDDVNLIESMISLDELIKYRDTLNNDYVWLKIAITEVIKKMNRRIIEFNECVKNGTFKEKMKDMSLWQKKQLLLLREIPGSDNYLLSNELTNFSNDSIDILMSCINEEELKIALGEGFESFEEYMLSCYKNDIKDKKIIDFRDIIILNYYKEKIQNKSNNSKK